MNMNHNTFELITYLKEYYSTLFPYKSIHLWLSYGDVESFKFREFSFTTVYQDFTRYSAFKDEKEMKKALVRLAPAKLDVGPIFNKTPILKNKQDLIPLKKELVIDIDLNDYDDVRICCSNAKICNKCWKYMTVACKIIDASLREDWGLEHILWIFSGRRGIHAWVCDPEIQNYSSVKRSAISGFFQLVTKNIFGRSRVKIKIMNRFINRTIDIIDEIFIPMCVVEQDMLGSECRMKNFIDLLPSPGTKQEVQELFQTYETSLDRWNGFVNYYKAKISSEVGVWLRNPYFLEEIKILNCYPRLDRNVTTALNHLLKLPFSMHPKTYKISIPFDPKKVDEFNPRNVPTITTLLNERNTYIDDKKNVFDKITIQYWTKTSLKGPIIIFNNFLIGLYKSRHKSNYFIQKNSFIC